MFNEGITDSKLKTMCDKRRRGLVADIVADKKITFDQILRANIDVLQNLKLS